MLNYETFTITEATTLQNELRHSLLHQTDIKDTATVAGADISHNKDTDVIYAGIVVLSYPEMVVQSYSLVIAKTTFPYLPGYLGFREVPALFTGVGTTACKARCGNIRRPGYYPPSPHGHCIALWCTYQPCHYRLCQKHAVRALP